MRFIGGTDESERINDGPTADRLRDMRKQNPERRSTRNDRSAAGQRPRTAAAKLNPPPSPAGELERADICDQIFAAGGAKLVLIRAAAGFGKTTVMRQLLQRCRADGVAAAWLTLDAADNDAGHFLSGLAAALAPLIAGLGEEWWIGSPDSAGTLGLHLIDMIERRGEPFLLFLDDFEVLHSPVVLEFIGQLLVHLPPGTSMIIGSRTAPDLGLGRLRAQGRLLEIDPAQLQFTLEETRQYLLARRRLDLQPAQIEKLHARTEGWPAALWLASLALDQRAETDHFLATFSGTHASIAEYLAEDVLARQPEHIQSFLLRTSILSDLTAPVCDAISGLSNSAELLDDIARAKLFLSPSDQVAGGYRYHALFAEFLRAQLQRRFRGEVAQLHQAASLWYSEHDQPAAAIGHAILSGDWLFALPLLETHAGRFLAEARVRLLARWFAAIPAEQLRTSATLFLVQVWVSNFTKGPHAALALLDTLDNEPIEDRDGLLLALRPMLLSLVDQTESAYTLGAASLLQLPADADFARSMLHIQMAVASTNTGRYVEAQRHIENVRRVSPDSRNHFSFALADALEGQMDLQRGRLQQALVRLKQAVEPQSADRQGLTKANAMAGILLAEALYESNEIDNAERLLGVYIPFISAGGLPDQLIGAHILRARIQSSRSDHEQAFQTLTNLEIMGHRLELPRVVLSARLERSRLAILQGKYDIAREELESAANDRLWARVDQLFLLANDVDTFAIATARLMLHTGHAAEALASLNDQLVRAEREGRSRRVLKLNILRSLALQRSDQLKSAFRCIEAVVAAASPDGFIRCLVDEGPWLTRLIRAWQESRERGGAPGASGDYLARLTASLVAPQDSASAGQRLQETASEAPVEALSRKELEVFRLVAEGLSNRALAERLFISEATVRTHLRNINVKLNAHSRGHAVAIARRHGILD